MPSERPSYPGVTLTVVVWAVIAVGVVIFRPLIPPNQSDPPLQKYTMRIAWRASVRQALIEAASTGRPVALCLVDPSTFVGQSFDLMTDQSRDVMESLNRSFVPVRVDVLAEPTLSGVWQPLGRASETMARGLQVVVLKPSGEFAGTYFANVTSARLDELEVLSRLEAMRTQASVTSDTPATAQDKMEGNRLRFAKIDSSYSFESHVQSMAQEAAETDYVDPSVKVRPLDLLAFLEAGQVAGVQQMVDKFIESHRLDWVGGKVLPELNPAHPDQVGAANSVALDADTVVLLFRLATVTGDSHYAKLAQILLRSLSRRLASGDPGSWSRVDPLGRPSRESWSTLRLSQQTGLPTDFVRFWQVEPIRNPSLVPTPLAWRSAVDDWAQWGSVMDKLSVARSATGPASIAKDRTDWCAYAVARVLPFSRGNPDVEAGLATATARLRGQTDPVWGAIHARSLKNSPLHSPSDPGSLALLCLSQYCTTGDVSALEEGRRILNLARARFRDPDTTNISGLGVEAPFAVPSSWYRPQLLDGWCQAPTTILLEAAVLFDSLDDSPSARARRIDNAESVFRWLASLSGQTEGTGGLLKLGLYLEQRPVLIVAGNQSVQKALEWRNRGYPALPVVAGCGCWQSLSEGVYRLGPTGPIPYVSSESRSDRT